MPTCSLRALAAASLLALPAVAGPPPAPITASAARPSNASAARAPVAFAGGRVGLYPLALPGGSEDLQQRLAAQLHDGASALPRVRAFDLIPRGACAPDEGGCLAAAARGAGVDAMVSVEVAATERGYRFRLRAFDARSAQEVGGHRAEVVGGPLDLAGALEHGVCVALGAAPCVGSLEVAAAPAAASVHLVVDGQDRGPLPSGALSLPVGRHLVRAGADERRVRVSYGRTARLACVLRAGAPALEEASAPAPALALETAPVLVRAPPAEGLARGRVARVLLAGGAGLVAAAAGVGLYAQLEGRRLDARYQEGTLADSDASAYGRVHTAGVAALIAGAAGLGALAVGGIVFAITPEGGAISGAF